MLCCVVTRWNLLLILVLRLCSARRHYITLHFHLISSRLCRYYLQAEAECEKDSCCTRWPHDLFTSKQTNNKECRLLWIDCIIVGQFIFILIMISFFDSFENADWNRRKPECIPSFQNTNPNRTRQSKERTTPIPIESNRNTTVRTTMPKTTASTNHANKEPRPTTRSCRSWASLNHRTFALETTVVTSLFQTIEDNSILVNGIYK